MEDPKLPALSNAINDRFMELRLSAFIQRGHGEASADAVRHKILKYKTGKHCVIQYWLNNADVSPVPGTVIGKLYRDRRSENRYRDLQALWETANATEIQGWKLGLPKPLALIKELGMLVQEVVPGKLFTSYSENDDVNKAIELIAKNMAVLHQLPIESGEKKTIAQHIEKYCRPGVHLLVKENPEFATIIANIQNRLVNDAGLSRAPFCPSHGDMGLAQVFINQNQAYFIDFDGFCLTHPALDIGNFLIALKTYYPAQFIFLEKIFIDHYLKLSSREMLAGLPQYKAFAYLRRAMICFRKYHKRDRKEKIAALLEESVQYLRRESCH